MSRKTPTILAISGGIGGAKLALGFDRILKSGELTVLCNTGDDFEHLGLSISPDLDTVMYTLAGLANPETGWGRADETWRFMAALEALGGETWFRLGDTDLAVHVERSRRLRAGEGLASITADLAIRLGVRSHLLPMSDQPVRTLVETDEGILPFQRYFVERQCTPSVSGFIFDGAAEAALPPGLADLLDSDQLQAIVICPSNPFISIDPILAVPGMREALSKAAAPVIAVSPIIGGRAVKGPTAKMMSELGLPMTSAAIAAHYGDLIDAYVLDDIDQDEASAIDCPSLITKTLMRDESDKRRLAADILAFRRKLG
jgi:LPPG:FO 2-phospho-L-lactate transferase